MFDLSLINPDLIEMNLQVSTKEEALKVLTDKLVSNNYVKPSYYAAILEREKVFPTGLSTEGIGVAIPHADIQHVLKPGIAVVILKNPVEFNMMEDPDNVVSVKAIFMLAISDSKMQLQLLQDLVGLFQDRELLMNMVNAKDAEALIKIASSYTDDNAEKLELAN